MLAMQLALALFISPPEVTQGDAVRLFYLHVPLAIAGGYLGVGLLAVGSIGYLWKRTVVLGSAGRLGRRDRLAVHRPDPAQRRRCGAARCGGPTGSGIPG